MHTQVERFIWLLTCILQRITLQLCMWCVYFYYSSIICLRDTVCSMYQDMFTITWIKDGYLFTCVMFGFIWEWNGAFRTIGCMDIKDVVEPTYPLYFIIHDFFHWCAVEISKKNLIFTAGLSCNNLKSTQWYLPRVATIEDMALIDV